MNRDDLIPSSLKADGSLSELATLQVRHVDAANGMKTSLDNATPEVAPIMAELLEMHETMADQSARILADHGGEPDPDGSWMSWVHEGVMAARGLFDGVDKDALPGLIDGEKRVLEQARKVLAQDLWSDSERSTLIGQRDRLEAAIARLKHGA